MPKSRQEAPTSTIKKMTNAPQLIDSALILDKLSNHYRLEFSPEEAVQFIEQAAPCCECWTGQIAAFLRAINKVVPPMQFGVGNPNNGKLHHHFLIGREYRRVIYLDIAKAYLEAELNLPDFIQHIVTIGIEHHAQEAEMQVEGSGGLLFRFWWKRCEKCN